MDWKFLFFSLKGRISRKFWWIGALTVELVRLGLCLLGFWLLGADIHYYWSDTAATPSIALVEAVVFVLTLRVSLAVDIKRIHDRGRTAYLLVPLYVAELVIIVLQGLGYDPLSFEVHDRDFANGYPFFLLFKICLIISLVLYGLWMLFELGFGKGVKGNNKYGPNPIEVGK